MSSIIEKLNTNCVSCNVLLNDINMIKNRKKCNKGLNNFGNKNKKPNIKHVYENNTMINFERTLFIGRSGCGKTFLMLSLLNDKNPDDVYIICKTDNQYPSKYHNQSSEILPLEAYWNKTIVLDDMLGSRRKRKLLMLFLLVVAIKILIFIISLNHGMNYLKKTVRNNCSRIMLFPKTLKVITMSYNDISGLHMNFFNGEIFCQDAWKK